MAPTDRFLLQQEDESMRKEMLAGATAVGAALIGGAAFYYLRERQTGEPDFRPLESDGDYQIRDYPAMIVAETVVEGPRRHALNQGFRILADYIFAKSRDGEKLEMTVPVMQDPGDPMASDPPLFDDELEGAWRTRFVMPEGRSATNFPSRPTGRARRASAAQGCGGELLRRRQRQPAGRAGGPASRLVVAARENIVGRARICLLQFADDPPAAEAQRGVDDAQVVVIARRRRRRGNPFATGLLRYARNDD